MGVDELVTINYPWWRSVTMKVTINTSDSQRVDDKYYKNAHYIYILLYSIFLCAYFKYHRVYRQQADKQALWSSPWSSLSVILRHHYPIIRHHHSILTNHLYDWSLDWHYSPLAQISNTLRSAQWPLVSIPKKPYSKSKKKT